MPRIIVSIEWDVPDDSNWLNPYNLELALTTYCSNTAFSVQYADDLLAALEAAPPWPLADSVGQFLRDYLKWYDGPRAAAIAEAEGES